MNVVLLGPPGAGKGTQSEFLQKHYSLKAISTGDMLRDIVEAGGKTAGVLRRIMDGGSLIPDSMVCILLADRIKPIDKHQRLLLDGFPRTITQAKKLDDLLIQQGRNVPWALYIETRDDDVIKRIAGRCSCPSCGTLYNTFFQPPKRPEICDRCDSALARRSDDNLEAATKRLQIYHQQTAPLLPYYSERDRLHAIDGNQSIDRVTSQLSAVTESLIGQDRLLSERRLSVDTELC